MALEFKVGRPRNLNKEMHDKIVEGVKVAFGMNTTAHLVGLPPSTLKLWLWTGAEDVEKGEISTIYAQLWVDYHCAKAKKIIQWLQDVEERKQNWTATWELVRAVGKEDFGIDAVEYKELTELYTKLVDAYQQLLDKKSV